MLRTSLASIVLPCCVVAGAWGQQTQPAEPGGEPTLNAETRRTSPSPAGGPMPGGQDDPFADETDAFRRETSQIQFSLYGGAERQFETDVAGPGEFDVNRYAAGLSARWKIASDWDATFAATYRYLDYDFDEPTVFGMMEPWGQINTVEFGGIFTWHRDRDFRIFFGPLFSFASEDNASFDDGFVGGGVIGVSIDVSPSLTIGLGGGVVSQIEDDARFVPAFSINWDIAHNLRLTTESRGIDKRSIELIYDVTKRWDIAIGGGYSFDRFRLDGNGTAPDGVGEDTSVPVYFRMGYRWDNASINGYIGVPFDGELTLENSRGNTIRDVSYDESLFIGIALRYRF